MSGFAVRAGRLGLALALLLLAPGAWGNGSFLWEATGKDNRVFLLGSIHALRAEDYPLAPAIRDAFRRADALVLEIRTTRLHRSPAIRELIREGAGAGTSLRESFTSEEYRRARELAGELGLDLKRLGHLEPWLVALVVTQKSLRRAGFSPRHGVDARLERRAREAGKPILTLETVREQLRLFQDLPRDLQADYLLKTLEEADSLSRELERLVSAWKAGDVAGVRHLVLREFRNRPRLYHRLVVERNSRWLSRLRELLGDRRDYLVVVGAAHLVGEEGLVNRLREAGYRVDRR